MVRDIIFDLVWWRNVPPGEFYNVERHPSVTHGGQGALYFEIPSSMVASTLDFLEATAPPVTIQARVYGKDGQSGPIEFLSKAGNRMRIARQNRQMAGSERHPAWTASNGFPSAPDDVRNKQDALPYFPEGGLRIWIGRTTDGDFYAGFTKGPRPSGMSLSDPNWDLYSSGGRIVGGVIDAN